MVNATDFHDIKNRFEIVEAEFQVMKKENKELKKEVKDMQDILASSGIVVIQQMEMLRHIMNVLKRYAPFDDEFQGLVDLLEQMKFDEQMKIASQQVSNCSSSSGNYHQQDAMGE